MTKHEKGCACDACKKDPAKLLERMNAMETQMAEVDDVMQNLNATQVLTEFSNGNQKKALEHFGRLTLINKHKLCTNLAVASVVLQSLLQSNISKPTTKAH